MFPRKGVRTFMLPQQDFQATEFMNDENIVITNQKEFFSAKEGVLFLLLQYEDYNKNDEDESEGGCLLDA